MLNVRATVVTPASRTSLEKRFLKPLAHSLTQTGGSVTITSNNPTDKPSINPNFFSNGFDLAAITEGVSILRQFTSAQAWNGFIVGPTGPFANLTTTESVQAGIRANAGTVFHPVGTCAMSAHNAAYGVVDPDLVVKKVKGLRIVDASIMVRLKDLPVLSFFDVVFYLLFFFPCSRMLPLDTLKFRYMLLQNVQHHSLSRSGPNLI